MLEDNKKGILLESGTNEIEVMQFTIENNLYGINVAKVLEIMVSSPVKPMPHAHPSVEGIFKPRDQVITVVELAVAVMSLLCVISLAALSRRRLRDVGYGAKSYLWLLLPVVGWIIFLARLCSKSAEPEIL